MVGEVLRYSFIPISNCDMCGSERHDLLGMRLNRSQGLRPKAVSGIAVGVKKCRSCGLVFNDPKPMPESLADHYGTPPEEYWDEEYFSYSPDYFAREIKQTSFLLRASAPSATPAAVRALDIGAGIGKCLRSMSAAGWDAHGLEPSLPFYERARSMMNISGDRLQHCAMEEAVYPAESFDFITFGAVLEHLASPYEALQRAMTWLRPGGIIQAEVPSSHWLMQKLINGFFRLRGTSYVTNTSPMHSPFHLFEFSLQSFVSAGSRLGFAVAFHEHQVCSIPSIPKFAHPPLRWLMQMTGTGMQLGVYLKKS